MRVAPAAEGAGLPRVNGTVGLAVAEAVGRAEATEVRQNGVQRLALDVLHRIEADAALLAVVEDADDIRVMQPRRGSGLNVESAQVLLVGPEPRMHHLQRDPALERLVLGLVDHPHPAAADPSEDLVVAQASRMVPLDRADPVGSGPGERAGRAADLLQLHKGRQDVPKLLRQIGMTLYQVGKRRSLTLPEPCEERFHHRPDRLIGRVRHSSISHRQNPVSAPGRAVRISLSRFNARI